MWWDSDNSVGIARDTKSTPQAEPLRDVACAQQVTEVLPGLKPASKVSMTESEVIGPIRLAATPADDQAVDEFKKLQQELEIITARLELENNARCRAEIAADIYVLQLEKENRVRLDGEVTRTGFEQTIVDLQLHTDAIQSELDQSRIELDQKRGALTSTQSQLAEAYSEIERASREVTIAHVQSAEQIAALTNEYDQCVEFAEQERFEFRRQIVQLRNELKNTECDRDQMADRLSAAQRSKFQLREQLNDLRKTIEQLKSGDEVSQRLLAEMQDTSREVQDLYEHEQQLRRDAESRAAHRQVDIAMLRNRLIQLENRLQVEFATMRKMRAACKRKSQSNSVGEEEIARIKLEEHVQRLTHELQLTRRMVVGVQQQALPSATNVDAENQRRPNH